MRPVIVYLQHKKTYRRRSIMPKYWFHHVHAVSEDFTKAAEFYEKFFGAKKVRIVKDNVDLDLAGTIIKIRSPRPDSLVPEAPVGKGLEHISFGTDNVEAAVKELKANGVRILQDVNSPAPGVKLAYVLGAGDVTIELLEEG
jgi:4-hydroxyphenylpyruvate dioxygenase-like putative hemolysin